MSTPPSKVQRMNSNFKLIVMDDDDHFYTLEQEEKKCEDAEDRHRHRHRHQPLEARPPVAPQLPADDFVDELQALNTSLCFLCSINADSSEVEHFLKRFPEALLLEGACLLPEDSAHYILEQHMRRCQCQGRCHQNRQQVFNLVQRGFEWYQSRRVQSSEQAAKSWSVYFQKLVHSERAIRKHRRQELLMRNTLIEAGLEFKMYKDELDQVRLKQEGDTSKHHSPLALLACGRNKSSSYNAAAQSQLSVLEYQVGVASVNLRKVERERNFLLQRIRDDRRSQFAVLKKAFEGCRRQDICSIGYVASHSPSKMNMS